MLPATAVGAAGVRFPFGRSFLPISSSRASHRSCLSIFSWAAVLSSSASIAWLWPQKGAENGLCNMTEYVAASAKNLYRLRPHNTALLLEGGGYFFVQTTQIV